MSLKAYSVDATRLGVEGTDIPIEPCSGETTPAFLDINGATKGMKLGTIQCGDDNYTLIKDSTNGDTHNLIVRDARGREDIFEYSAGVGTLVIENYDGSFQVKPYRGTTSERQITDDYQGIADLAASDKTRLSSLREFDTGFEWRFGAFVTFRNFIQHIDAKEGMFGRVLDDEYDGVVKESQPTGFELSTDVNPLVFLTRHLRGLRFGLHGGATFADGNVHYSNGGEGDVREGHLGAEVTFEYFLSDLLGYHIPYFDFGLFSSATLVGWQRIDSNLGLDGAFIPEERSEDHVWYLGEPYSPYGVGIKVLFDIIPSSIVDPDVVLTFGYFNHGPYEVRR